jgi:hypothetical protein
MLRTLSELIERRLETHRRPDGLPPAILASERAHGLLGLLDAWLWGRHRATAAAIADHLVRGAGQRR